MRASCLPVSLFAVLTLSACAVRPPEGPTIMAAPGRGKTFDAFRTDDYRCRVYASGANGGASGANGGASGANGGVNAQQAANNKAVGGAVAGTLLGAAAGALLGAASHSAGVGAAFGAGSGLLIGSAIGADNAGETEASMQANYDRVYAQCMIAAGEDVTPPPVIVVAPPYGYAPYPVYRPGYYYAPAY